MALSLRLSEEETNLIKNYAKHKNMTVSQLIRDSVIQRIEDEYDLNAYKKAMAAHKKNPVTYSHQEVARMLDLE